MNKNEYKYHVECKECYKFAEYTNEIPFSCPQCGTPAENCLVVSDPLDILIEEN